MKRKRPLFEAVAGRAPSAAAAPAPATAAAAPGDDLLGFSDVEAALALLRRDAPLLVSAKRSAAAVLLAGDGLDRVHEAVAPVPVVLLSQLRDAMERFSAAPAAVDAELAALQSRGQLRLCKAPTGARDFAVVATDDLRAYLARRRRQGLPGEGAGASGGATGAGSSSGSSRSASPLLPADVAAAAARRDALDAYAFVLDRCRDGASVSHGAFVALFQEWVRAGRPPVAVVAPSSEEGGAGLAAAAADGFHSSRPLSSATSPSSSSSSVAATTAAGASSAAAAAATATTADGALRVLLQMGALMRRTDLVPRTSLAAGVAGGITDGSLALLVAGGSSIPHLPQEVTATGDSTGGGGVGGGQRRRHHGPPGAAAAPSSSSGSTGSSTSTSSSSDESYYVSVPEAGRLWQYVAAGRAELVARLKQRR